MKTTLIIGGAGYIGSHMVKLLQQQARPILVLDNLSTGHRDAVRQAELVTGHAGDASLIKKLLKERNIGAVMHFAAFSIVGESVRNPEKYQQNNVEQTRSLLSALQMEQPGLPFIFSSTAAVYGNPASPLIDESHPLQPVNPYGDTKRQAEQLLEASGLNYGILRYFNAAGADPDGELGERHDPETHLIPLVLQAASGRRNAIAVFGEDYDTPDGSCVRDYIHVNDLCRAHLLLLDYLLEGGQKRIFNLGTGQGYSVREVIDTAQQVTGRNITVNPEGRRAGDPPVLVANGSRAKQLLGWEPQRSDLPTIIADAWQWERQQADSVAA